MFPKEPSNRKGKPEDHSFVGQSGLADQGYRQGGGHERINNRPDSLPASEEWFGGRKPDPKL